MRANGLLVAGLVCVVVGLVGVLGASATAPTTSFARPWLAHHGSGMPGMAGALGGPVAPDASPIRMERASAAAQDFIDGLGNPNLALDEAMEFTASACAPSRPSL